MKISIILLSRNREKLLESCLESIIKTTTGDYEIIIGCDSDSEVYTNLINKMKDSQVSFVYEKRHKNLHTYINKLARMSSGEYLFVLNDDCELVNTGWDEQVRKLLNPKLPLYGRTYDDSIDRVSNAYAAFPIVTRTAYNRLGFFMDETFGNHGSDVMTYRIYNEAGLVVSLSDVQIKHVFHNSHHALQQRLADTTATDMINRTFEAGFSVNQLYSHDVTEKAKRLYEQPIGSI